MGIGTRISEEQALDCFASDDLIGIGMEADAIRRERHPEGVVSYTVERSIAFDDTAESDEGRTSLLARVRDAVRDGASTVCLVPGRRIAGPTAGIAAATALEQLEAALTAVRERFPDVGLQASSASGILRFAAETGLDVREVLLRLRDAGLDSIGDDGAETPQATAKWIEVHRSAHEAGLRSTASLTFGAGESAEDRVARLFAIRTLQQQTGGFVSFALWSAGSGLEAPTAVEYLRTLAISRIVLDNVEHVESSCVAQGLKLAQMTLRFGADDLGAIFSEDKSEDGQARRPFTEEDVRRVIRDAGFMPVERDLQYRAMYLMN
jgi:cyclic dehypoxanthinyl futalosine synthase